MTEDEALPASAGQPAESVVSGERVYLGPISMDYLPVYRRWINDLRVSVPLQVLSLMTLPLTTEDEQSWYESVIANRSQACFTIYELNTNQPVGNISLENINLRDQTAAVGLLIGEVDTWGRGYATEALQLVLDYGFTVLNLHSVHLQCVDYNKRALRIYERVGFRHAGVLRQAWQLGQKRYDVMLMDILAEEFASPVLARQLEQQFGINEE